MLFEKNNDLALAEALHQLAADERLRIKIGRNARQTVENRYNISNVAQRYIQLYSELLQKSDAGSKDVYAAALN